MGYNPWGHKESDMTQRLNKNNVSSVFATCNLSVKICISIYWSIDLNAVKGHM